MWFNIIILYITLHTFTVPPGLGKSNERRSSPKTSTNRKKNYRWLEHYVPNIGGYDNDDCLSLVFYNYPGMITVRGTL